MNTWRYSETREDMEVFSNLILTASVEKKPLEDEVWEYQFSLKWDAAQIHEKEEKIMLRWEFPCIDAQYMWHPNARESRVLNSEWMLNYCSMLTLSAPMAVIYNAAGQNTYTMAMDEVKKVSSLHMGVQEDSKVIAAKVILDLRQFVGQNSLLLRVYIDKRRLPFHQTINDVRLWWEKVLPGSPAIIPENAKLPVYSTWYNFHRDVNAVMLEKECRLARNMGMHTIILDDGWNTEVSHGNYGYTGDWEVCKKKFPDMRAHVKRVHDLGMKYMLWFSVPYMGYYAKRWPQFKDKILYEIPRHAAGVLDPRYPEVREYLTEIYAHAVREFDIDGLKLDFIDQFAAKENDQIKPGMDYLCVQEAVDRLLTGICDRLRALKPDILIEFRQSYIGPAMRRFGNMFRVGDCAMDITKNRVNLVDLRLMMGGSACHSDMLCWGDEETAENAALQILNSLFGVIQFSQIIHQMPAIHKEMAAFWLGFAIENRRLLLESQFIPLEPNYLYPVIQAQDEREAIIGVYATNKIIDINTVLERIQIINATKAAHVYLRFSECAQVFITSYDVLGREVLSESKYTDAGILKLCVPCSGLLVIKRNNIDEEGCCEPFN